MNRQEILDYYRQNPEVSVLIIGGGVNGIGTFRDLALQDIDVLLVDKNDFNSCSLEFIDQNTLLLLDDSSESSVDDNVANDHEYRIIERVSTSSGAAARQLVLI